jgi:CRISPR type I-E-associated protein CasB/Cse2
MTEGTITANKLLVANTYMANLHKLRRDAGAMAMLRRGLGENHGAIEMFSYVFRALPADTAFLREDSFLQIAALYALHPEMCSDMSFGGSFRKLWQADRRRPSTEARFKTLLAADKETVVTHLHRSVTMMKNKGIRIDYARLLVDLNNWEHEDNFVQKEWAKDFWGSKEKSTAPRRQSK